MERKMALSESELDTKIQKQTKLDELKKVRQKVQDKAKQLQDKLYYFMFAMLLTLSFTSCEKDDTPTPDNSQMIVQEFSLMTVTPYDITKSFDPQTWVYNYSNVQYELKLQSTDGKYTYTKNVSVNEMLAGSVSFQMWAGTYDITYTSIHQQRFDNVLDVSINMSSVQINGSPMTLEGTLADALIIFDRTDVFPVIDEQGQPCFFYDERGFWYAYVNSSFSVNLVVQATGIYVPVTLNPDYGKVYWYSNTMSAAVQLIIPALEIERYTF